MSWGEAFRLALVLLGDPSSQVGAAFAGLRSPFTPESFALYQLSQNYFATHTEARPRLMPPLDPTARAPRPRARLSAAEVDEVFHQMTQGVPARE